MVAQNKGRHRVRPLHKSKACALPLQIGEKMKWLNKNTIFIMLVTIALSLGSNVSFGDFEDLGVGARPIGMGSAFVGLVDDVNTIYYNPAGLGQLKGKQFTCGYGKLYWGLNGPGETNLGSGFVGYGHPLSWGTLGVGWLNLNLTKYYQENTFIFCYGKQISRPLYMGMNLKLLSKRYGEDAYTRANPIFIAHGYSAQGFSADLGALCNLTGKLSLGLAVMDVNQPNIELAHKGSRVPLSVKIGFAYKNGTLNLALDSAYKDRDVNVYAGAEKWFFSKILGIRGGLGIGSREYRSLSLGTSFSISVFEFDYAFIYPLTGIKQIYGSHRLSLTIHQAAPRSRPQGRVEREEVEVDEIAKRFRQGMDFYQREKLREAIAKWEEVLKADPSHELVGRYLEATQVELDKLVEEHYQKAREYYNRDGWEEAIYEWNAVLSLRPGDEWANEKIEATKRTLDEHFNLGMKHYEQGNYAQAIKEWQQVLEWDSRYYGATENIEKASHKIKEMEAVSRERIIGEYFKKGLKYYRAGDYFEAVTEWRRALDIDPQRKEAMDHINLVANKYFQSGMELYDNNKFMEAIEEWKKALIVNPDYEKARSLIKIAKKVIEEKIGKFYTQGIQSYNEGNYIEAIKSWKRVLEVAGGYLNVRQLSIEAHLAQGILYYREDKLERAIGQWKQVLLLQPEHEKAQKYLKRATTKQKRLQEIKEMSLKEG